MTVVPTRPSGADDAPNPTDVTVLLGRWSKGEPGAADEVIPLVYPRLRALAASLLSTERRDHTLDATGLANEAYIDLRRSVEGASFEHRGDFFCLAATVMRRALIDHARRRAAAKRGGDVLRVTVPSDAAGEGGGVEVEWLDLSNALDALRSRDPRKARLVELRFFAGRTVEEAAGDLGISPRTAAREWRCARALLYRHLTRDDR